jgi:tetratricopeptide (TPR) repeat protein
MNRGIVIKPEKRKAMIATTLAIFLLTIFGFYASNSEVEAKEKKKEGKIKRYDVDIFMPKARERRLMEKLQKAHPKPSRLLGEGGSWLVSGGGRTHTILEGSVKEIHNMIRAFKKVGSKDIIEKIKVLGECPKTKIDITTLSREELRALSKKLGEPKIRAKGGVISLPYLYNKNIKSVLKLLENQTKYSFKYRGKGKVNIAAMEVPPLKVAFDIIFKENGYRYKIKGHTVYVYKKYKKLGEKIEFDEIAIYKKMIKKYPKEKYWGAFAQNEIGKLYLKRGKYSKALEEFQKLVDNYPKSEYVKEAKKKIKEIKLKHLKKKK